MLQVPVYNQTGQQVSTLPIDESHLGGKINPHLLKQAVVMYLANRQVGTAAAKGRGDTEGSTRKIYKQKGTGNARMGTVRTCIRKGGGVAFAKRARDFSHKMPKQMRRLACRNAVLSKILSNDVIVLDSLSSENSKTKNMRSVLSAIGANSGALLAIEKLNPQIHRAGRNIAKTDVLPVGDLNAYAILKRKKLVFTKLAFDLLVKNAAEVTK